MALTIEPDAAFASLRHQIYSHKTTYLAVFSMLISRLEKRRATKINSFEGTGALSANAILAKKMYSNVTSLQPAAAAILIIDAATERQHRNGKGARQPGDIKDYRAEDGRLRGCYDKNIQRRQRRAIVTRGCPPDRLHTVRGLVL